MKGFLYGQTEYNILNNSIHLDDYISKALENGFDFLSITDNNLFGCYKFYQACLKNNIKPIIGLEVEYIDEDNFPSVIILYALNNKGFKNLLKISTLLKTNPKPNGLDFMDNYKEDLAVISVFNDSIFSRYFTAKCFSEINNLISGYNQKYNFYIGYSFTNRLDKININEEFLNFLAKDIRVLPIHNCRYLINKDTIVYEALTQIANHPVKISECMDYSFLLNPSPNKVLDSLIKSINLNLFTESYKPKFPKTKDVDSMLYLRNLCQKGLNRRLLGKISSEYQKRLNYELDVIHQMGYDDYFLIVWDFILYAKKRQILVGPGRGSAAGSLVAYCLGITEIDPLKYDLLFERFLNPQRTSMPDIDTDFPDVYRDDVINYVNEVYGAKHVCSISAYNTFLIRSSIRDVGRILKFDNKRLEEIIKLTSSKDIDSLLLEFIERKDIYNFLYIIKKIDGLPRHISTHAAGIIISDEVLDDIVPLQKGINGIYQSQLEASDLEKIGLLKIDFLGIKNLTIISNIIDSIPNFTINSLKNIPLDDKRTYDLLASGDTLGVFQLESAGIRKVLMELKPRRFDDIVAVLALYRPGPMDNIPEFIARHHGKKFNYLHNDLIPILKGTYGIIVYQEQIMLIARTFADFSLAQADLLRRAVSKKNEKDLLNLKSSFISGAIKKGYSEALAHDIYNYILKFANYGFNKSHSVAYGLVSYQMAYLKANYFNVFMSKILNNVIGDTATMADYIKYAKTKGVVTFKPDVNISSNQFEINKIGLFMPFNAIKGIGEAIALDITKERKINGLFKSFSDFKNRLKLSVGTLEALIYAGALDGLGMTKRQMIDSKEAYNDIFAKHINDLIVDEKEFEFEYLRKKEFEYLGINIKYDIFQNINSLLKKYSTTQIMSNGKYAIICFENIKMLKTKKNEEMLVGTLSDSFNLFDFVIFPKTLKTIQLGIEFNQLYLVEYNLSNHYEGKTQVVVDKVIKKI